MSLRQTDADTEVERWSMITNSVVITFILALTVGMFIWYFVHIPVKKIIYGMDEISSGNLNYQLNFKSRDEIGILATSFNSMASDLKYAKNEITRWSDELENRVREKTNELEKTQEGVLQIEKMASIGKLSATVAHELNNPLAGILTYSKLIQKKLLKNGRNPKEFEDIIKYLKMIESESDRCGTIIKNLLLFSKKHSLEIKPNELNAVVEQSILLIKHHLQLNNIDLKTQIDSKIPVMYFDDNQVKQALLAVYLNAIEAIENEGELKIETGLYTNRNFAFIKITDTGRGIAGEIKNKIFEPFFTTKDKIKGVGLGLSTAYGIIKRHYGDILLESEVNVGTTFTILLPLKKIKIENE
jgi:two-component system NtrC family sensor kinase